MMKINFKKVALLIALVISLLAFVVVPSFADEVPTTGASDGEVSVSETETSPYADFDAASEYLDEYTTNKSSDPDFETNVEIALDTVRSETPFYASFWALLPPLIAIALALITKEVYSSLFIGIVAGGILAANFNVTHTVDDVIGSGLIDAVSGTAGIFVFLVILGVMVALINKSGGSAAFGRWASKNIKSRVGATMATFILGVLIFIDDYLFRLFHIISILYLPLYL